MIARLCCCSDLRSDASLYRSKSRLDVLGVFNMNSNVHVTEPEFRERRWYHFWRFNFWTDYQQEVKHLEIDYVSGYPVTCSWALYAL